MDIRYMWPCAFALAIGAMFLCWVFPDSPDVAVGDSFLAGTVATVFTAILIRQ
jgi:hypothetical protein